MLKFDGLSTWLPGQGVVLDDVQFAPEPGEIWAVVGRSGAGASTLLRAASNRLPHGALLRGRIRRHGSLLHVADLPPVGVADFLGAFARGAEFDVTRYGAEHHLDHRTTSTPPDVRAGLLLAALHQATPADTVLVDAQLTAAPARIRQEFGDELVRRAGLGAAVCWADHDLPTLLTHASHVLELGHGQVLAACPVDEWVPATLPDPRITPDDAPHRPTFRSRASSSVVEPTALGLTGNPIDISAGVCLGIVCRDARPEPVARRLVGHLGGDVLPSGTPLSPDALATKRPLWLPHAQAGLDAVARRELIARLSGENPGVRIVTGRDENFLRAACHEIVVIEGGAIVAQGAPNAVAALAEEGWAA
ncbi:ATP-binding cassette domain-containing protein [uncultured Tessaracoccus sp.]|uniref:ATP-binding cassette domain-containing protein n=1 Tax=uncultured Tessaracoccus sp. TaxID=905023 RepID=UPI00262D2D87|nr:ATP-binding cassette domain-containing protein [uncultured Tessaracoccus sp.]